MSQAVLEVVVERPATSPTSPSAGYVAVSQAVLEVVVTLDDEATGGGDPGGGDPVTTVFGYAT